jgi:hypothetical protein
MQRATRFENSFMARALAIANDVSESSLSAEMEKK